MMQRPHHKISMSQKVYNWDTVSDYLRENTQAGLQIAVLEADKILIAVIRDLNYPGKNGEERLLLAQKLFSDFDRVKKAHRFAQKIRREISFSLTPKTTEEILAVYYQALLDIKEHHNPRFKLFEKIVFYFKKRILKTKKLLKWIGIGLPLFLLATLFLDKTKIGHKIVKAVLAINDFIFSWLIILIFLAGGIIALTFGSIWYFKTRHKIDIDMDININKPR